MAGNEDAQVVHDLLLAHKPGDVTHDKAACTLCPADIDTAKEVANVADRTFTEAEHAALLTDAVSRETETLTASNATLTQEKAELTSRVDILEAEKVTTVAERDTAVTALDEFKADVEAKELSAARKEERTVAVKAANENLPEEYFTAERVDAWSEMAEQAFNDFVDAIKVTPVAPAAPGKETAAFVGGQTPPAPAATPASTAFLAARRGASKGSEA